MLIFILKSLHKARIQKQSPSNWQRSTLNYFGSYSSTHKYVSLAVVIKVLNASHSVNETWILVCLRAA